MISDFVSSGIPGYETVGLTREDINYIKKYWIKTAELTDAWSHILNVTFLRAESGMSIVNGQLPDVKRGGLLFVEDEFEEFKQQARCLGASRFAVIEDVNQADWQQLNDPAFFRFCYPIDISWQSLAHSCSLAEDVFLRPIRCFFVVLDSGAAGKYVNNDAEIPYELVFARSCGIET